MAIQVEKVCELASITLNRNAVPGDASALSPGGVRVGAPAMTTRGCKESSPLPTSLGLPMAYPEELCVKNTFLDFSIQEECPAGEREIGKNRRRSASAPASSRRAHPKEIAREADIAAWDGDTMAGAQAVCDELHRDNSESIHAQGRDNSESIHAQGRAIKLLKDEVRVKKCKKAGKAKKPKCEAPASRFADFLASIPVRPMQALLVPQADKPADKPQEAIGQLRLLLSLRGAMPRGGNPWGSPWTLQGVAVNGGSYPIPGARAKYRAVVAMKREARLRQMGRDEAAAAAAADAAAQAMRVAAAEAEAAAAKAQAAQAAFPPNPEAFAAAVRAALLEAKAANAAHAAAFPSTAAPSAVSDGDVSMPDPDSDDEVDELRQVRGKWTFCATGATNLFGRLELAVDMNAILTVATSSSSGARSVTLDWDCDLASKRFTASARGMAISLRGELRELAEGPEIAGDVLEGPALALSGRFTATREEAATQPLRPQQLALEASVGTQVCVRLAGPVLQSWSFYPGAARSSPGTAADRWPVPSRVTLTPGSVLLTFDFVEVLGEGIAVAAALHWAYSKLPPPLANAFEEAAEAAAVGAAMGAAAVEATAAAGSAEGAATSMGAAAVEATDPAGSAEGVAASIGAAAVGAATAAGCAKARAKALSEARKAATAEEDRRLRQTILDRHLDYNSMSYPQVAHMLGHQGVSRALERVLRALRAEPAAAAARAEPAAAAGFSPPPRTPVKDIGGPEFAIQVGTPGFQEDSFRSRTPKQVEALKLRPASLPPPVWGAGCWD